MLKCYLANSQSVLAPVRAVDFGFQQRILPLLRGHGSEYEARIRSLAEQLAETGCERSARHVRESLAVAEVNLGDIDFMSY